MDKESITDSHLVHKDKEKHKYVAKIDKGNKKYRYFYDKEEYQNYLKGKNVVGNLLSNIKVFNGPRGKWVEADWGEGQGPDADYERRVHGTIYNYDNKGHNAHINDPAIADYTGKI